MIQACSSFSKKQIFSTLFSILCTLLIFNNTSNVQAYSFPPEVMDVVATNAEDEPSITISWTKVDPNTYTDDVITNYKIYYGTKSVQTVDDYYENDVTVAPTENTYTFKDLEAGGTYYFSVTAVNSSGDESVTYSVEVSATATNPNPPAPVTEPEPIVVETPPQTTLNNRVEGEANTPPIQNETPTETVQTNTTETEEPVIMEDNIVSAAEPVLPKTVDTTPPLNPNNLLVNTNRVEMDQTVTLTWNKAIDVYNDIHDQVLYTKEGFGVWDSGYSIGPDIESVEIDVELNQNYEIKIVTVDTSGNESDGATYIFSTHLAESGPNSWISIILAIILFLGLLWTAVRTKQ